MGYNQDAATPEEIWDEISFLAPIFEGIGFGSLEEAPYWPGTPVCDVDRIVSTNGKIKFSLPTAGGSSFKSVESCDSVENWFAAYLEEVGLGKK
jgi:predicted molibdopterin-dependent oxidoreductase YjgC